MSAKSVTILGVTGSIGRSASDVVASDPSRFSVQCVTAHTNTGDLAEQAIKLNARKAVIADPSKYAELKERLTGTGIEAAAGQDAIEDAAAEPADIIVAAIIGMAGLPSLMKAIAQGKCVAIANKEPLVAAGPLVMAAAQKHGTTLLPVDSEHNAIFQVFDFQRPGSIDKIILTASGGPFLRWGRDDVARATPAQALAHPNWTMGRKISIDSATMMNKALEVIEAHYLFDMPADKIHVLIHPQSIVHSMVSYKDGSVLAQMGASDMRTPISHVLGWPDRMETPGEKLDFSKPLNLQFEPLNPVQFPALALAYHALEEGLSACLALNAANEIAVAHFLEKRCSFLDIMACNADILSKIKATTLEAMDDIIAFDADIRRTAVSWFADTHQRKAV